MTARKTPHPPLRPPACKAPTKTGRPCKAAVRPSGYCALHDPDLAGVRAAARKRAGESSRRRLSRRTLPGDTPALPLDSSRALVAHLSDLIRRVETGELDTKPAAVVAQLSNVLLRALANVEQLERIEAIETAVAQLTPDAAAGVADDLAALKAAAETRQ